MLLITTVMAALVWDRLPSDIMHLSFAQASCYTIKTGWYMWIAIIVHFSSVVMLSYGIYWRLHPNGSVRKAFGICLGQSHHLVFVWVGLEGVFHFVGGNYSICG